MADLIYSGIVSLDGYLVDANGSFDWAMPDEEVHAFINDLERSAGTYLLGRRMYEVMSYWETVPTTGDQPQAFSDYARIWQAADKVVYSTSLERVSSARTRIERDFDAEMVRTLKATNPRDIGVGGAGLAAQVIAAGLVDDYRVFLAPVTVGGGTPFFPLEARLNLHLVDERRFPNGFVYLRYRSS